MSRAIVCSETDDTLAGTRLADVDMPHPGPGKVRVAVRAASLNPVDWKLATGFAPWLTCPQVLGVDGAGVVDAVGPGVSNWRAGERVAWHGDLRFDGAFADYALVPAHVLARVPEAVSFDAAAALPCAAMTAYQALVRKARIEAGQTILVQGASGAVGGFAVQIARLAGATVIALARPGNAAAVRALGADHVFQPDDPRLGEQVRGLTRGYGADIMLEVVNPGDARRSLELIRYNGQLLCIDPMPDLSRVSPYTHAASIHEIALGGAYAVGHRPTQEDFAVMLAELLGLVKAKKLDPMIAQRIPLESVPAALRQMKQGGHRGKIVVDLAR
jgi:NADPH2:quinone reductase